MSICVSCKQHGVNTFAYIIGVLMVTRVRYVHLGPVLLNGRKSFAHLMVLLLLIVATALQFAVMLFAMTAAYVAAGLVLEARERIVIACPPGVVPAEGEAVLELGPGGLRPQFPQRRRPAGWRRGSRFTQRVVPDGSPKP